MVGSRGYQSWPHLRPYTCMPVHWEISLSFMIIVLRESGWIRQIVLIALWVMNHGPVSTDTETMKHSVQHSVRIDALELYAIIKLTNWAVHSNVLKMSSLTPRKGFAFVISTLKLMCHSWKELHFPEASKTRKNNHILSRYAALISVG